MFRINLTAEGEEVVMNGRSLDIKMGLDTLKDLSAFLKKEREYPLVAKVEYLRCSVKILLSAADPVKSK